MGEKEIIYICMGSACHQYGVYDVLPILQRLLADHHLDKRVLLKGAFCLGPCVDGIVLKFGDGMISHVNVRNIEQIFHTRILPKLKHVEP